MTEKERLMAALRGLPTDRPPCICPGGMMNMITSELMDTTHAPWPAAHSDPRLMAELAEASVTAQCFENYGLPFCMTVEVEAMGAQVDMGTHDREPHVTGYAIDSVKQWREVAPLNAEKGRAATVLEAIRLLKKKDANIPIVGNLTGPISVATSLMEPSTFYKELRKNRDDAKAFVSFIAGQLLHFGLLQMEAGADVITISDPSASGEILGPVLFAEYVVPALAEICTGLKARFPEAGVIVHICGQMRPVFDAMAQVPAEAVSFDAVVNLSTAKEKLQGKRIMGNVSTFALELANPAKIAVLTRKCMETAHIISPACGMGTGSPLGNVRAILATVKASGSHA